MSLALSSTPRTGHAAAHEEPMEREGLRLGVIGGSGLEEFPGLEVIAGGDVETPFGDPSDQLIIARAPNTPVEIVFLSRHGRNHDIPPHQVNYRANICALKMRGATHVVGVSAVGSMREQIQPGHLIVPHQLIDWTRRRATTFFDDIAAHVALADPICPIVRDALVKAAHDASGHVVHDIGVHITIDGPQFSTRAESDLYRSWGVDVIGMTAMPEAKLAREAELPYALLCLATDYDCWHPDHAAVDGAMVARVIRENADAARRTILELVKYLPNLEASPAHHCLDGAIATKNVPTDVRERLTWLRPFAPTNK